MSLPLKIGSLSIPYNCQLAVKRGHQLVARLKKKDKFLEDYRVFMKDVIDLCAEKVPPDHLKVQDGKIDYLPHTGVHHSRKQIPIGWHLSSGPGFQFTNVDDYHRQLLLRPWTEDKGQVCRPTWHQRNLLRGILCSHFPVHRQWRRIQNQPCNSQDEIQKLTDVKSWCHSLEIESPADIRLRGCLSSELVSSSLWWKGPVWLKSSLKNYYVSSCQRWRTHRRVLQVI